jgi:two-component system, chemotaxis family, sensor kinase CheA
MTAPDAALLQIFREETEERLARVSDTLLALESGAAAPQAVDSLFRDVHSIKGNAGMVGFDEARALAHSMEDTLEGSRENGVVTAETIQALLAAADEIARSVAGDGGPSASPDQSQEKSPPPETEATTPVSQPSTSPSIRVSTSKVDDLLDVVGEAAVHGRRMEHLLGSEDRDESLDGELDRGERLVGDLQDAVLELRTLPLSSVTGRLPRAIRDLAQAEGKEVELVLTGTDTQLDRTVLDGLSETLMHLLSNAVVHGIESPAKREAAGKPRRGRVELVAGQRGGMVAIEVSDDGGGVPDEVVRRAGAERSLVDVLAQAGFSTAAEVSQAAGRGVGLDAVKTRIETMGGSLEAETSPGSGTTLTLLVPLTLALLHVLLVERTGQVLGIPLASVAKALPVDRPMSLGGRASIELEGRSVPLGDLYPALGGSPLPERPPAVVVTTGGERVAAMCDSVIGEQEIVVKSLGPLLAGVRGYLGAAVLGDGRVALILDPAHLSRRLAGDPATTTGGTLVSPVLTTAGPRDPARVLVVDDQFTVRELQRSILEAAGYRVDTARDGREALTAVAGEDDIALVVTDVQMPVLDGFELVEEIRSNPERSHLPVVMVTSQSDEEHRRRGAEAGADAYIVKQEFDQQALLDTVSRLIGA